MSEADYTVVSHEQDGRILSGVGADVDDLAETMARHAPPEPEQPAAQATPTTEAPAGTGPAADVPRNEQGQFAKTDESELVFPDGSRQKPQRGQKRFQQLTAHAEAWRRHAESTARERDELKRSAESRPRTPEAPPSSQAPPAGSAETRTASPVAYPDHLKSYDAYVATTPDAAYEDFLDARADFRIQTRLPVDLDARVRASIEADRASRTLQDHVSKAIERGRQVYPDFDAVLQSPHMQAEWHPGKLRAIAQHEAPERIQYALGKDPELAERLRLMTDPVQFGMALAQIVPPAAVAPPASTARTMGPPPPTPSQPVGGGSKTTVPSSAELANGFDFDRSGYRERRAAERGGNRR